MTIEPIGNSLYRLAAGLGRHLSVVTIVKPRMPRASQAISLLLVGTTLCTYGYTASELRQRRQMESATQPYDNWNGSSSNHYYHGGSYHTWGSGSDEASSDFHSFSHGGTERGGFGGHGHAVGS